MSAKKRVFSAPGFPPFVAETPYAIARHWWLHGLQQLRSFRRVHRVGGPAVERSRCSMVAELHKLRCARAGVCPIKTPPVSLGRFSNRA